MMHFFFSSKIRVRLLQLFIKNPTKKYYIREISKLLHEPLTPIRRELIHLKTVGFLKRTQLANLIYYGVNEEFLLYDELKSMVMKTEKAMQG